MTRYILSIFLLTSYFSIYAQQSMNMNFMSSYTYSSTLSDVWGYANESGEFALVGLYTGISILDVTNPTSPNEIGYFEGPNSTWRDLKSYGDYVYCINETGGGLQILNIVEVISDNINPTYIENLDLGFATAHNIYIDENGRLYVFGANYSNGGAMIFDLNSNPIDPTLLGNYSGSYFHDGMVRGDTLWGGAIYNGEFSVVDVSNPANPNLLATQSTPNNFTHNCWISDDGNTLFTTDEVSSAFVTSYDISDLNNIEELDRIQAWSNETDVIPHNTHVAGDFLVTSYYRDGVSVVDASHPSNLIEVGYYDTSESYSGSGFNGAWGTYPFLPSGNILVSDIENGLFVIEAKYTNASFIEGTISNSETGAPISNVIAQITGTNNPSISALDGFYESGIANEGTYEIIFSAPGYNTLSQVITLSANSNLILDVSLIPSGCMDFDACNYNPFAVLDDGSCTELDECGECGGLGPDVGYDCEGNCVSGDSFTLSMIDSYGDGWNGNSIIINQLSYGFTSGYNANETLCFDPESMCVEVICDGGTWQSEVSWVISDISGNELLTGGAPFSGLLCFDSVTDTICQNINFNAGWSIFSTYIMSENMLISELLSPLNTNQNLVIVKDVVGTSYLPQWDYNGIGEIDFKQGYLVKTNNNQSLLFCGTPMYPEDHAISLLEGWNMFSYLRTVPADTEAVFNDIKDHVTIVKNNLGDAYLPEFNYNGIGDLESGSGYVVKMISNQSLLYLSNNQEY
jgi:choice-of-anchor B domain-containing protein